MATTKPERVYTLATAPDHPIAAKYGITERQFRRWVQAGKISYARPGGQRVLLTSEDIERAILGSRIEVQP